MNEDEKILWETLSEAIRDGVNAPAFAKTCLNETEQSFKAMIEDPQIAFGLWLLLNVLSSINDQKTLKRFEKKDYCLPKTISFLPLICFLSNSVDDMASKNKARNAFTTMVQQSAIEAFTAVVRQHTGDDIPSDEELKKLLSNEQSYHDANESVFCFYVSSLLRRYILFFFDQLKIPHLVNQEGLQSIPQCIQFEQALKAFLFDKPRLFFSDLSYILKIHFFQLHGNLETTRLVLNDALEILYLQLVQADKSIQQ